MKLSNRFFASAVVALITLVSCQLTLANLVIIGIHADGTSTDVTGAGDAFAWVPLVDLTAGDKIHFSDTGYHTIPSALNTNPEGLWTYTVPMGGISAGTVLTVSDKDSGSGNLSMAGTLLGTTNYTETTTGPYSDTSPLAFDASGDQLFAFRDDDLSDFLGTGFEPLFAVNLDKNVWDSTATMSSENQSALYPGFTSANSVAVGDTSESSGGDFDNARYIGITTGTVAQILAAVANVDNWERTNDAQSALTRDWVTNGVTQFTVVPEPSAFSALAVVGLVFVGYRKLRNRR